MAVPNNDRFSVFDEMESLRVEASEWLCSLQSLNSESSCVKPISETFSKLMDELDSFCAELEDSNLKVQRKIERREGRKRVKQEATLNFWHKSMVHMQSMYRTQLSSLERSVRLHKKILRKASAEGQNRLRQVSLDIEAVAMPALQLNKVGRPLRFSEESDLISNRSAFSLASEIENSHRSRRIKKKHPPLPPSVQMSPPKLDPQIQRLSFFDQESEQSDREDWKLLFSGSEIESSSLKIPSPLQKKLNDYHSTGISSKGTGLKTDDSEGFNM